MAEIPKTINTVAALNIEQARQLIFWADHCNESYWLGEKLNMTLQGILNIYHASGEYVDLDSWLEDDPKADKAFDKAAVYAPI